MRSAGLDGAPALVGVDEDGRERLVFIEQRGPVGSYQDWSQPGTALASIATLLRELHDATRETLSVTPGGTVWLTLWAGRLCATTTCARQRRLP
jgi:hypothetical protein